MSVDYREELEKMFTGILLGRRDEAHDAIRRLRKNGRSYEGIYTAMSNKPMYIGNEKGFGLLFMESYQSEIDKKVEERAARAARVAESSKDGEEKPAQVVTYIPPSIEEWEKSWGQRTTKKIKFFNIS